MILVIDLCIKLAANTTVRPYFDRVAARLQERKEAAGHGGSGWDARKKELGVSTESQRHNSKGPGPGTPPAGESPVTDSVHTPRRAIFKTAPGLVTSTVRHLVTQTHPTQGGHSGPLVASGTVTSSWSWLEYSEPTHPHGKSLTAG